MDQAFFNRDVVDVARDLLGMLFCVDDVGGVVVETEAYDGSDPASHSFNGPTRRNQPMFGAFGHAYVYRSYGLHWCMNMVCTPGSAVLIRALEPVQGLERMQLRRSTTNTRLFCSGPGRLCQALAISGSLNGVALGSSPFRVEPHAPPGRIAASRRIGLSKARDTEWRFCVAESRFLSRPA